MSISIGTEDPEFYAEIFCKISRLADRHLPSSCPDVPGIQEVDGPLTQRLQTVLDAIADISLCEHGNVSATVACVKDDNGSVETRLFIIFNHEDDEASRRCKQHLEVIFNMLRRVPYKPSATGGSSKVIADELKNDFIEICKVIHEYSFNIFTHRVTKREHKLSEIRTYIEEDRTHFTPQQRTTLLAFLEDVDLIIKSVAQAQTTKKLSTTVIKMLRAMFSYWTKHDLLPKDLQADKKLTLLDNADALLADEHGIGFRLQRWAVKIMSFVTSANRLFALTQSHRLRTLTQGRFSVEVLPSPTPAPYICDLSSETVLVALDAALAESDYHSADWNEERKSFIEWLLKAPEVERSDRTIHAELAMIMAMAKGKIKDVLPYVGVSKVSCIMCRHFIYAFNEVTKQKIATKGSHGKAYPGWFWPSIPDLDEELRTIFSGRMRQQLRSDFEHYAKTRRLSDSSLGHGGPEWQDGLTRDDVIELSNAQRASLTFR